MTCLLIDKQGADKADVLSESLGFTAPSPELLAAFNTSGMLLVAADGQALPYTFQVALSGWNFDFAIGETTLIVKSMQGKLYDREDKSKSLIGNVSLWTARETFLLPIRKTRRTMPRCWKRRRMRTGAALSS